VILVGVQLVREFEPWSGRARFALRGRLTYMTEGSERDVICVVCDCRRQRTGTKCPGRENLSLIQYKACRVIREACARDVCAEYALRGRIAL
jgi:hypothetical protein